MKVSRSKSGLPTLTENGGGMTNTGYATIITNEHGAPIKPLFVPRGYSNGNHAIFVARPGMLIVHASRSRGGESVRVERIVRIHPDGPGDDANLVTTEPVGEYENGDSNLPEFLTDAVQAALQKSRCYHCRSAHYIVREA